MKKYIIEDLNEGRLWLLIENEYNCVRKEEYEFPWRRDDRGDIKNLPTPHGEIHLKCDPYSFIDHPRVIELTVDGKPETFEFLLKYDFDTYPIVVHIHTYWLAPGRGSRAHGQRDTFYAAKVVDGVLKINEVIESDEGGSSATGHSTSHFCQYLEKEPTPEVVQKFLDDRKIGISELSWDYEKKWYYVRFRNYGELGLS